MGGHTTCSSFLGQTSPFHLCGTSYGGLVDCMIVAAMFLDPLAVALCLLNDGDTLDARKTNDELREGYVAPVAKCWSGTSTSGKNQPLNCCSGTIAYGMFVSRTKGIGHLASFTIRCHVADRSLAAGLPWSSSRVTPTKSSNAAFISPQTTSIHGASHITGYKGIQIQSMPAWNTRFLSSVAIGYCHARGSDVFHLR